MMGKSNQKGVIVAAIALTAVAIGFAWYTNNQPYLDPKETEAEVFQINRELKRVQHNSVADYPWAKSIQNLKTIGEAMLKYRKSHASLPVAQRRSWHDAGLPEHLYLALTELNQPWTIPSGTFVMPIEHESIIEDRHKKRRRHSDYDQQYGIGSYSLDQAANIQRAWATKGEDIIILSDNTMNTSTFLGSYAENPKQTELLVLRLNGKVERITIDSHMYSNLAPNY